MLKKINSRLYSTIPSQSKKIHSDAKSQRLWNYLRQIPTPSVSPSRVYSEGKPPKKPGKAEEMDIKMPGFIHPETMNEEGYFTQKAKLQLEELKRKGFKPNLSNPEKKE